MANKCVFMTGVSGYIGSDVVNQAIQKGYQIHAFSRTQASDERTKARGAAPVRRDFGSYDVLREQNAQTDTVLHLADARTGNYEIGCVTIVLIDNAP